MAIALLIPTHPLTASWVILVVGLRAVVGIVRPDAGTWLTGHAPPVHAVHPERQWGIWLGLAVMTGMLLALLWPYDQLTVLKAHAPVREGGGFGDHPFRDLSYLYLLAVLAAALFVRLRRHGFLILAFLVTWSALQAFRLLDVDYFNRYAFFQSFFAHVAVAEVIGCGIAVVTAQGHAVMSRLSRPVQFGVGVFTLAALLLTAHAPVLRSEREHGRPLLTIAELIQAPSAHDLYYMRMAPIQPHLYRGDVVMMPVEHAAWDVAALTGARVVAAPFSFHTPDFLDRLEDVQRFFSAEASERERAAILCRYGVNKILLTSTVVHLSPSLQASYGPPLVRHASLVLYDIPRGVRVDGSAGTVPCS